MPDSLHILFMIANSIVQPPITHVQPPHHRDEQGEVFTLLAVLLDPKNVNRLYLELYS
jgi:hypothetical protein